MFSASSNPTIDDAETGGPLNDILNMGQTLGGLGDIGNLFPDSDDRNKNRRSREFLTDVYRLLRSHAIGVVNIDATLIAQAPKLAPFLDVMRSNLSADLVLDQSFINVKATTTEGLGFTGRAEGIAAHAVVLVEQFIA